MGSFFACCEQDVKRKSAPCQDSFSSMSSNVCKYLKTWLSVDKTVLLPMFLMSRRYNHITASLKSHFEDILQRNR